MYGEPVCGEQNKCTSTVCHGTVCVARKCTERCVQEPTSSTNRQSQATRLSLSLSVRVLPIELSLGQPVHWRSTLAGTHARCRVGQSDRRPHYGDRAHSAPRAFWHCLALSARAVCSTRAFTVFAARVCVHGTLHGTREAARLAF